MEDNKKFLDYIVRHHSTELESVCEKYVEGHPNTYREKCEFIRYSSSIDLCDIDYQYANIQIIKGVYLAIDIHANVIAEVHDGSSRGLDSEQIYNWVTIRCKYHVIKDELTILNVIDYDGKTIFDGIVLDDNLLIPKIYGEEGYEKVAKLILEKYYPEVISNIMPVDPFKLAERLNLKIKEKQIVKDGSVFGQIIFSNTEAELGDYSGNWKIEEIEKNTLLIDKETGFLKSFGSPAITISHECVHYIIHKAAFFFAKKFKKKISKIQCRVQGQAEDNSQLIPLQQFEIQANKLAPMLLMPKEQFSKKARDVIRMVNTAYGGDLLDKTQEVIEELAQFYNVTRYSVRKRLAEIGYEYMLGSMNYVDGHYVTPYSFDNGSLKYNETFTISKYDYFKLFEENNKFVGPSNFNVAILSGSLVFVDNHIVINDPKYVKKDALGRKQLTNEARRHLNRCAIKFKVSTNDAIDSEDRIGTMCYLCRDTTYTYALDVIVSDEENGIKTKQSFDSYLTAAMNDNKDLANIAVMPHEEALVAIMDKYEITINDLVERSGLSRRTISRYRGEDKTHKITSPDKETVVRICLGLQLTPFIASNYLKACGVVLNPANKQDLAYETFITGFCEYNIEECNSELIEAGLKPFLKENE